MLQLTPHQRFFLGIEPLDFRKGIDAIAAICESRLKHDPMSGALFIFTNRSRVAIKILVYDGQGFWLCTKRFSQGKLAWWPQSSTDTYSMTAQQLYTLLYQGNPMETHFKEDWKRI